MSRNCEPIYVRKRAGAVRRIGLNLTDAITRLWQPGYVYPEGMRIRPTTYTGFQYQALNTGQSGAREPRRWPIAIGATIQEGAVEWEAEAVDDGSLERTVSSVVWTPQSPLTLVDQDEQTAGGQAIVIADIGEGDPGMRGLEVVARITYNIPPIDEFLFVFEIT